MENLRHVRGGIIENARPRAFRAVTDMRPMSERTWDWVGLLESLKIVWPAADVVMSETRGARKQAPHAGSVSRAPG
jgi:hypothetical protein